jgi:hypothetical protein
MEPVRFKDAKRIVITMIYPGLWGFSGLTFFFLKTFTVDWKEKKK